MTTWILIVRVPGEKPLDYLIKPGKNTIGRSEDSDIVVRDDSASRQHAEIVFNPRRNSISIHDHESTNGTFVNRERLTESVELENKDVIRIGSSILKMVQPGASKDTRALSGTRFFSKDQILEALDHHAVLMYEISERLNTITELDQALDVVTSRMKDAMGAEKCEIILAEKFDQLDELGYPQTITDNAIQDRSAVVIPDSIGLRGVSARLLGVTAAMCIPIIADEIVLGLIYMYKADPDDKPFTENDLQVAIAISHQAALTIQRVKLLQQIRQEQSVRQVLQRFVSPQEAEYLLADYADRDGLPGLDENQVTVMFIDMVSSTRLAEKLGTKAFGRLLNEYYGMLTEIIFSYHGMVRYVGDGAMAVFGMLGDRENKEVNAVCAGLEILSKIKYQLAEFETAFHVGVGVNTGKAVIGYVGTEQRVELTVLGDTVNLAHRIQRFARPNRLLVDVDTIQALEGQYFYKQLEPVTIKGFEKPVQIFEILAESEKWSQLFT